MSEQAEGHRRLADVVDALEAMGARVGEANVNRARDGDVHVSLTADLSDGADAGDQDGDVSELQAEIEELQEQRDALEEDNQEQADRIDELKERISELRRERDELQDRVDKLEDGAEAEEVVDALETAEEQAETSPDGAEDEQDEDEEDSREVIVHSNEDAPLTTYHEDSDCRYAKKISEPRAVPLSELDDDVDPCGNCEGGADDSDSDLEEDELREAYEEHDGVVARVAEEFDADYTAVYTRLRGLGIHEAHQSSADEDEADREQLPIATWNDLSPGRRIALEALEECSPATLDEVVDESGLASSTMRSYLQEFREQDIVESEEDTAPNRYHLTVALDDALEYGDEESEPAGGGHPAHEEPQESEAEADGGVATVEEVPEQCDWLQRPADAIVEDAPASTNVGDVDEILDAVEKAETTIDVRQRLSAQSFRGLKDLLWELGLRDQDGALLDDDVLEERIAALREVYVA